MKKNPEFPEILVAQSAAYAGTGQCDCDCDCACAETGPALGQIPFQETSRWQKASGLVNLPVSPTHNAIFNPDLPVSIAYCNETARQILDAMEQDHSLSDLTCRFPNIPQAQIKHSLEVLASLNLVTSGDKPSSPVTPRQAPVLTAWLHLTDRCNLRCDYCYLPHRREDMSIETGKAAIDAVFRSARKYDYERIKLKYAGGEPFCAHANYWNCMPMPVCCLSNKTLRLTVLFLPTAHCSLLRWPLN
jgi:uncharacterized protein